VESLPPRFAPPPVLGDPLWALCRGGVPRALRAFSRGSQGLPGCRGCGAPSPRPARLRVALALRRGRGWREGGARARGRRGVEAGEGEAGEWGDAGRGPW